MRIYVYEGIPMVHISTFAQATNRSICTARTLLDRTETPDAVGGASKRRPLKYFRDGSTLWIPVKEITGYPFVKGTNVYHFDEEGNKYLCTTCTFTPNLCDKAKEAAELEVPVGDP